MSQYEDNLGGYIAKRRAKAKAKADAKAEKAEKSKSAADGKK